MHTFVPLFRNQSTYYRLDPRNETMLVLICIILNTFFFFYNWSYKSVVTEQTHLCGTPGSTWWLCSDREMPWICGVHTAELCVPAVWVTSGVLWCTLDLPAPGEREKPGGEKQGQGILVCLSLPVRQGTLSVEQDSPLPRNTYLGARDLGSEQSFGPGPVKVSLLLLPVI